MRLASGPYWELSPGFEADLINHEWDALRGGRRGLGAGLPRPPNFRSFPDHDPSTYLYVVQQLRPFDLAGAHDNNYSTRLALGVVIALVRQVSRCHAPDEGDMAFHYLYVLPHPL